MNDPKTTPAYGRLLRDGDVAMTTDGLTQYAEVAARFHAACIPIYPGDLSQCTSEAFHHADAFFAELAKRTAP